MNKYAVVAADGNVSVIEADDFYTQEDFVIFTRETGFSVTRVAVLYKPISVNFQKK